MASYNWPPESGSGGMGTVTSVGLQDSSTVPIYNVTNTPVLTSGTLTLTLKTEAANSVFAGPSSGSAAQPTFRSLVAADLPTGNLTSNPTTNLSVSNGGNSVIGSGVTLVLTGASLIESTSSVLTITGATNAVLGTGVTIQVKQATTAQSGYLSSTDWNTFNGKQASGNYITGLTGDATASGPGSVAVTLATVNSNTGAFGSSTSIPTLTVNAKGLVTAASGNVVIAPAGTLSGTTLNATVVSSSLTSVGTLTTGTWNATTIAVGSGGTGAITLTGLVQGNGTGAFTALSSLAGNVTYLKAPTVQVFTSGSGTYTTPTSPAPIYLIVEIIGGGAGGVGGGSNGTAGNATTFGNLTAAGGSAGSGGNGGTGGAPTVGSGWTSIVALTGGGGGPGNGALSSGGGIGASGPYGGAGVGGASASGGGNAAANTGGGGGGTGGSVSGGSGAGAGAGAFIRAMAASPASTYSYSVGAAAAGGTAGSLSVGGGGASGLVTVTEYYQ